MGEKISRRDWVKVVGGTAAGLAVGGVIGYSIPKPAPPPSPSTGGGGGVKEVVIAGIQPCSGTCARLGTPALKATELAVDLANKRGGIPSLGGAKIRLVTADSSSDTKVDMSEVERIITTEHPAAIVGVCCSYLTIAASEVSERYHVPIVCSTISDKITGRGFKYIFQTAPKGSQFGEFQVICPIKLGEVYGWAPKNIAILYEETDYGTTTAKGIKDTAEKYGLNVVLYDSYPHGLTDASDLVSRIMASGAEAIYPVSYITDAILIIKTLRDSGGNQVVVGGGAGYIMPEFIDALGDRANYIISVGSTDYSANLPGVKYINELYKKATGEKFLWEYGIETFNDTFVVLDAINRAASVNSEDVRNALAETDLDAYDLSNPFWLGACRPGAHIKFDESGWNSKTFPVVIEILNGKHITIYPPEVATPGVKAVWPPPGLVK